MAENRNPRLFYGYIVVVAAFLVMVMMWGTYYSFGVFFKPLLADFGWTRAMTSGAYALSFILFGLVSVVAGKLTDRFGPRVVVAVCCLFLGLGYLLLAQMSAAWQLYLFYGVMVGISLSGSYVPLTSTVARWFVKRRGLMTGIAVSGVSTGIMAVTPVTNWLISNYGWRNAYMAEGIAVLVLIIVAAQFLKRDPGQMGRLPYGEDTVDEGSLNLKSGGFSLEEAIQTRQLWQLCLLFLFVGASLQTAIVHIVPHVTDLEISATTAASVLAVIGGVSIGGRLTMGSAGDRIGNKKALIISIGLVSISFFWLLVAKELWMLYLFAVIFGFGFGGIGTLMSPIVAEHFGLSSHGVILGVILFVDTIGESLGPVVAGYIFDTFGSYNQAFLGYAIIDIIALVLVLSLKPVRKEVGIVGPGRSS